jgi:hypothetical protein
MCIEAAVATHISGSVSARGSNLRSRDCLCGSALVSVSLADPIMRLVTVA